MVLTSCPASYLLQLVTRHCQRDLSVALNRDISAGQLCNLGMSGAILHDRLNDNLRNRGGFRHDLPDFGPSWGTINGLVASSCVISPGIRTMKDRGL